LWETMLALGVVSTNVVLKRIDDFLTGNSNRNDLVKLARAMGVKATKGTKAAIIKKIKERAKANPSDEPTINIKDIGITGKPGQRIKQKPEEKQPETVNAPAPSPAPPKPDDAVPEPTRNKPPDDVQIDINSDDAFEPPRPRRRSMVEAMADGVRWAAGIPPANAQYDKPPDMHTALKSGMSADEIRAKLLEGKYRPPDPETGPERLLTEEEYQKNLGIDVNAPLNEALVRADHLAPGGDAPKPKKGGPQEFAGAGKGKGTAGAPEDPKPEPSETKEEKKL
jgi:hypothetical protein